MDIKEGEAGSILGDGVVVVGEEGGRGMEVAGEDAGLEGVLVLVLVLTVVVLMA